MEKSLADIKPGNAAVVVKINLAGAVKRRVMDLGITKGTVLFVRKTAPLGDPVEINVRGFCLSIRKCDAKKITVVEIKNT